MQSGAGQEETGQRQWPQPGGHLGLQQGSTSGFKDHLCVLSHPPNICLFPGLPLSGGICLPSREPSHWAAFPGLGAMLQGA